MSQTILFDRDEVQQLSDLHGRPRRLGQSRLLWVDLDNVTRAAVNEVADELDLAEATAEALLSPKDHAFFQDHGRYLHLTTYAPHQDDERRLHVVECIVGERWVVTAHDRPIPVLEEFAARVSGSGDTGSLDGPSFLAALLEWVLGAYSAAFEAIGERLEDFDVHAMRGRGDDKDIEQLVTMRREVGVLHRALAAHRSALVALTHPELEALGNNASSERFVSLFARFESTVQEARDAREAIVGSFEVLIARGGHHTNQIMKVLTLVSVILLPGALLAGLLGMNFPMGFFQVTWLFWVVLAVVGSVAPATIGLARWRGWI